VWVTDCCSIEASLDPILTEAWPRHNERGVNRRVNPSDFVAGDGRFNQLDIDTAQRAAASLRGPCATIVPGGQTGDGQTSRVCNPDNVLLEPIGALSVVGIGFPRDSAESRI
jgi:hypothetical protein